MEQLVINVENTSVLPALRKVLSSIEGVSILPKEGRGVVRSIRLLPMFGQVV